MSHPSLQIGDLLIQKATSRVFEVERSHDTIPDLILVSSGGDKEWVPQSKIGKGKQWKVAGS